MKYTIFYSWQSDLPNNTNRGFISSVLEESMALFKSENFEIELALDRDTKDLAGSPNIVSSIIEKIQKCDIFVADISIIHGQLGENQRRTPNPNVLLELGYALATIGTQRTILFFNESFGGESELPFDIRQLKRINYRLLADDLKAPMRKELSPIVAGAIKGIVQAGPGAHRKVPILKIVFLDPDDPDSGANPPVFTKLPINTDEIVAEADKELRLVEDIDGSRDPAWTEKLEKYQNDVKKFIDDLKKDPTDYYHSRLKPHLGRLAILVVNEGNLAATDIRITVKFPESFLISEEFPEFGLVGMPERPRVEIPVPHIGGLGSIARAMAFARPSFDFPLGPALSPNLASLAGKRTSACSVRGTNEVYFWADRLIHKHQIFQSEDAFYAIPKYNNNAPEVELEISVFCSEQDDRETRTVRVPMKRVEAL